MTNKNFLALMAIGDAYGMKYEFTPHAQDKTVADLFYGPHVKFTDYPKAHYTDDTQMSLGVTELLLSKKLEEIEAVDFINGWLGAFRRDPHLGYSKYMLKVMSTVEDAAAFQKSINATQGVTSGAAMRAGPLGLLPDVEDVKKLTVMQAKTTHDTPAGITSALAVSLTVHFLHHGGTRHRLAGFLEMHLGADWCSAKNGYSEDPNNGLKIVSQALRGLQQAKTLSEVLLTVVNQDSVSDTDTACALAMIMASRCADIVDDLPAVLHDDLENGSFGRAYLQDIDQKLATAFPGKNLYYIPPPLKRNPGFKP